MHANSRAFDTVQIRRGWMAMANLGAAHEKFLTPNSIDRREVVRSAFRHAGQIVTAIG